MKNKPMIEIVLRKYELPSNDFEKTLKFFLLSLGFLRPGDKDSLAEKVFEKILKSNEGVTVSDLAKELNVSESAVRYHISKFKEIRLVEGRRRYRIAEGDLFLAFTSFKKYVVAEVLERIEEYVKKLIDLLSQEF